MLDSLPVKHFGQRESRQRS